MKPRLLDLFCGAGGAAMGYHRAGFEVVGVDMRPQPNYPFEFLLGDALVALDGIGYDLGSFDAIHASPPCQRYSTATKRNGTELEHPDLIGEVRSLLRATGLPYVIENVIGAPLENPILTCGATFLCTIEGYYLRRHRLFETNWGAWFPGCACRHAKAEGLEPMDVTGGGPTRKLRTDGGGGRPYKGTADEARRIMGIDWMTKAELNEAIPPVYTEALGHQLMQHLAVCVRSSGGVSDPPLVQPETCSPPSGEAVSPYKERES